MVMVMKSFYYHGSYLNNYNKEMLREDALDDGLFDKFPKPTLDAILGGEVSETHQYRSRYSYSALMESVKSYFITPRKDHFLDSGVPMATRYFAPHLNRKLEAIRLDDPDFFHKAQIKLDKSAGLTNYNHSKMEASALGLKYAHQILNGKTPHPCLASDRTQNTQIVDSEGNLKPKTRLVWMYPLEMTILESVVARPLIEFYLGVHTPMVFGKTSSYISTCFQKAKFDNKYVIATDQSKFDQHARAKDIRCAFNCFRKLFDLKQPIDSQGHTVGDVFNIIENYFIFTPLVFPSPRGPQITKDKKYGVPSGSYFTQMVDSYINYAVTIQIFRDLHVKFSPQSVFVLGDDMVAFAHSFVSVSALHEKAAEYGYNIHDDEKSQVLRTSDPSFDFLGRHWTDNIPTRTFQEVVDHALYPER